jgi:hypothetical protein
MQTSTARSDLGRLLIRVSHPGAIEQARGAPMPLLAFARLAIRRIDHPGRYR